MPADTQRLEILNGWKEIANYLGKSIRSVQRYELQWGLPVRHPSKKGSVMARKLELDDWIAASPMRGALRLSRPAVDNASALQEFHGHVEELHRLRQEAAELRGELRSSLDVLRASISVLRLMPCSPERRLPADVLNFEPSKEKVH